MILDEKFWLAVCFAIFVGFTYRPIKKAILGMIDSRIDLIRNELKNAKVMRMEAEAALQKSQAQLDRIIADRDGLLKAAKADIDKVSKEGRRELEILLELKERDAENRLEQLKTRATKDLSESFTKAARELTEKYLSENKAKLPKDEVLANHLLKK